jgi:hypothetical protein
VTNVKDCLDETISILRIENPDSFNEILSIGKSMHIGVKYGSDQLLVEISEFDVLINEEEQILSNVDFWCFINPQTFFDLLESRVSLFNAIWSKNLEIMANPENLLKTYRIVEIVLLAVMGSPAFTKAILSLKQSSFP